MEEKGQAIRPAGEEVKTTAPLFPVGRSRARKAWVMATAETALQCTAPRCRSTGTSAKKPVSKYPALLRAGASVKRARGHDGV